MDSKSNEFDGEIFRQLNEKSPLMNIEEGEHAPKKQRVRLLSQDKLIGLKTITSFGSICLIVNNVNGPGMLELPALFQTAGWIPCTIMLVLACAISSILSVMFSEAISKIPGNSQFCRRMEYSSIFDHFMGSRWFYITQFAFFLFLFTQSIASIVSTAQSLDSYMSSTLLGEAYALQLYPLDHLGITTWSIPQSCLDDGINCSVFANKGSDALLISLGYIVTSILFLPLCFLNLEENITWQKVSFVVLCVMTAEFIIGLYFAGDFNAENMPAWGSNLSNLPGLVVTNYAFGITMPSWLCEKRSDVPEKACIWFSTVLSTLMYILFSVVAALAMAGHPDNILDILGSNKLDKFTRFCSGSFGLFIIGLGIPVFSVLMRYNLVVGGVCSPSWGMFFSSVLPFLISWTMYQGHVVLELLSWSGTFLSSLLNFYGPMFLVLIALHRGATSIMEASNRKKALIAMMSILTLCISFAAAGHLRRIFSN